MSYWKVILATMVIFACGVITGAMVSRTVAKTKAAPPLVAVASAVPAPTVASNGPSLPPAPVMQLQRVEFLRRLDRQLALNPDQHDEIARIMKASQERTQPVWNQIAPQMREELKKVREEIRGVLTAEQRKEFAELLRPNRKSSFTQTPAPKASRPGNLSTNATQQ